MRSVYYLFHVLQTILLATLLQSQTANTFPVPKASFKTAEYQSRLAARDYSLSRSNPEKAAVVVQPTDEMGGTDQVQEKGIFSWIGKIFGKIFKIGAKVAAKAFKKAKKIFAKIKAVKMTLPAQRYVSNLSQEQKTKLMSKSQKVMNNKKLEFQKLKAGGKMEQAKAGGKVNDAAQEVGGNVNQKTSVASVATAALGLLGNAAPAATVDASNNKGAVFSAAGIAGAVGAAGAAGAVGAAVGADNAASSSTSTLIDQLVAKAPAATSNTVVYAAASQTAAFAYTPVATLPLATMGQVPSTLQIKVTTTIAMP